MPEIKAGKIVCNIRKRCRVFHLRHHDKNTFQVVRWRENLSNPQIKEIHRFAFKQKKTGLTTSKKEPELEEPQGLQQNPHHQNKRGRPD